MAWLALFLIIGLAGLILVILAIGAAEPEGKAGAAIFAGVALICNVVLTVLFSVHFVDAKHIGVTREFGKITGQVGEGIQITWPWVRVEEWNIRLQYITPDTRCSNGTPQCLDAGSFDTQDVYVNGTLNMEVDVRDVQNLSRNIGPNYIDNVVHPRMQQVVKRVVSKYKAVDVLPNREEIRIQIVEGLKAELKDYSINAQDFLLTNIDFTDEFRLEIDKKTVAEQQALTAENVVRVREAEARQASAQAQGVADRLRIEAAGQADANRTIAASLTPQLIQFQAVQKLTDKVQIALIPSGQGIIIDPATLLRTTP